MIELYNTFFYQPLFNLLVFLYNIVPGNDLGIAIALMTILIKVALFPLAQKSLHSQRALQQLQPRIDALRKQYANDATKLSQSMMQLYKENKVNPLSSCLPLFIQLPFLIAMYQVFRHGIASEGFDLLYPFVAHPGAIRPFMFSLIDLAKPSIVLAVVTAAAQYVQGKMLVHTPPPVESKGAKDESMMSTMNKQMMIMMPIVTLIIGISLPAGLLWYWLLMTLLTIIQQKYFLRPVLPALTQGADS